MKFVFTTLLAVVALVNALAVPLEKAGTEHDDNSLSKRDKYPKYSTKGRSPMCGTWFQLAGQNHMCSDASKKLDPNDTTANYSPEGYVEFLSFLSISLFSFVFVVFLYLYQS